MEASDGETLATRLRRLSASRGWSDEDAARAAGITYRHYQRWLAGESDPRGSSLRRLAETFEVLIDELVPGGAAGRQLERIDGKLEEVITRLEAIERRLTDQPPMPSPAEAVGETVDRLSAEAESPPPPAPGQPRTRPAGKRRRSA